MGWQQSLLREAASDPKHIVLAEGEDERILDAAVLAASHGVAKITLLGREAVIKERLRQHRGAEIAVIEPENHHHLQDYIAAYRKRRGARLKSDREAVTAIRDPLGFAAMMVRQGDADGTVAGAVATTADTIRAALRIIGRSPTAKLVSSFFLMLPNRDRKPFGSRIIFADCALVVEPDAGELADIAVSSAHSAESFLDRKPRIAMLSFSTAGSGVHPRSELVREATELARQMRPDLEIDGEIQFDAAVDAALRRRKAPDSLLGGMPNVFIFPNLDAANIGYKIAATVGGMTAVGPVLQGLAKPANDLSRGCKTEDILYLIAVTSLQAARGSRRAHLPYP